MRNVARVKSVNPNDVEGAVLALVAYCITEYAITDDEEDFDEYADMAERIAQEYCPLFRLPEQVQTEEERAAITTMRAVIATEATKMLAKLRSSRDPLFRALAGQERTAAE